MINIDSLNGQKILRAIMIFCNREERKGKTTITSSDADKIHNILIEQGEHISFSDVKNVLEHFLCK